MCAECGVTDAQYQSARWVVAQCATATMYARAGRDPALFGLESFSPRRLDGSMAAIERRHRAHPSATSMTAAEFRAWFDGWRHGEADRIRQAVMDGC